MQAKNLGKCDRETGVRNERRSYDYDKALKEGHLSQPDQTINLVKAFIQNPEPARLPYIRNLMRMPYGIMFSDDIFEMARLKDLNLFKAMEEERKAAWQQLILFPDLAMNTLQLLLHNHPNFISNQSLVDIITKYPNLVNEIMTIKVEKPRKQSPLALLVLPLGVQPTKWVYQKWVYQSTGNTLLHQLIIEKRLDQIKAYLSAIFQAKRAGVLVPFDVENKNGAKKTILQLALETCNKENKDDQSLISAILVYADPNRTGYETQINTFGINIPEILRLQRKLDLEISCAITRQQQAMSIAAQNTDKNLIRLALQQQEMGQGLIEMGLGLRRVALVTDQNHSEIGALQQHVSRALPYYAPTNLLTQPTAPLELKAPSVYDTKSSPVLFAPDPAPVSGQGQQATLVVQKAENPLEELRSIRQEMDHIRRQLAMLEQRSIQLETTLMAANEKGCGVVMHTN